MISDINGPGYWRSGPLTHLEFSTPSQRLGENPRTEPTVIGNDRWYAPSRRALLRLAAAGALAGALPARAQDHPDRAQKSPIGVIGAGNIGSTIGGLWVKAGHPVLFASRHPEDLAGLVREMGPLARAGTVAEALAFGEAVLLAVPYRAYPDLGRDYAAALSGKIVLDAGNATRARDGDLAAEAEAQGIGATSAKYLPGARIVRVFNAANYQVFQRNAHRSGGLMAVPLAGDDPKAVAVAEGLVRDAGFDPVVVGPLDAARRFAMGSPGFGLDVTAPEARRVFGLQP
ncbi:NADPH-dependent F420 reductase [Methylobacterium nodulans]|uniref:NADP oxidoreductase coenzyme F420-dependent n=1 Tax=Methylobacterium nodulans (strain LMG 21967 / CNCM I-2342 / ORS 2060) TaxID=460265 RepID=B8IKM4_METNO|nr:NADPH-dependent F420 reductase [Methylobacterium nodulans]ACL56231.1 NADP oxidoreductase coenzyme F420-dependent [Methylobacterium nodulans ORS 2060]